MRFQKNALIALQEAAEAFMVHWLEQVNDLAIHAKRVRKLPSTLITRITRVHRHVIYELF